MTSSKQTTGHRERLRSRFSQTPQQMDESEVVELLLTFAIPRQDVAPLAKSLLSRFGSFEQLLGSNRDELMSLDGIGENAATLIQLVSWLVVHYPQEPKDRFQLSLFDSQSMEKREDESVFQPDETKVVLRSRNDLRTFANDEIANSVALLSKAPSFAKIMQFQEYLAENLPYNSATTRRRRANHIMDRFFPRDAAHDALLLFLSQDTSARTLHEIVFYHVLRAEPLAAKVATELVWSSLPIGRIDREEMREFILKYLPTLSKSSQANALRSILTTYDLLGVGQVSQNTLYFRTHDGTLDSFVYILLAEFPNPGIYSFEQIENSPMHKWMLWDRQWIRRQLYNLRDLGILAKVSEIDTVRQFTLTVDQISGLRRFFDLEKTDRLAVREVSI